MHKPGKQIHVADTLSRAYTEGLDSAVIIDTDYDMLTMGPAFTSRKLNEMQTETAKDETCQALINRIKDG